MSRPELAHSFAEAVPGLSLRWRADEAPAPELVALNEPLASELGLDIRWLRSDEGVRFLAGGDTGAHAAFAQAYAGHQFGAYSPRLGDGRAVLLGELRAPGGRLVDLHLKGSGATPFSRGGDGKAAIGPMLRELAVGEFLHAAGVPTSRALAVVATGERIIRGGELVPGAIACRVAASHLRVGTFQYAAASGGRERLGQLADYAIARHRPEAAEAERPALALLEHVAEAQAELIARWMLLGFVHGVMNTDNAAISGESLDFGPCAFLDGFDPRAVFSSIDRGGRYAYGSQPSAALWNLARLGEALLPLIDDDEARAVELATAAIGRFEPAYRAAFGEGLARKAGAPGLGREEGEELLELLAVQRADWTAFFRELGEGDPERLLADPEPLRAWRARCSSSEESARAAMHAANPPIIPRNRVVDEALAAATADDPAPALELVEACRDPWSERARERAELREPPPADAAPFVSFCGT